LASLALSATSKSALFKALSKRKNQKRKKGKCTKSPAPEVSAEVFPGKPRWAPVPSSKEDRNFQIPYTLAW
jgi:hypothetical protein